MKIHTTGIRGCARRTFLVILLFMLGVAGENFVGCGGGGGDQQGPSGSVSTIDTLSLAVVRIIAQGAFEDPAQGSVVYTGSGSGFFIDSSGLVVTNNHVVTGAATLEVYVTGENDPRHATFLGVSECSDLAVIDVEGEGFSFLTWFEDEIEVGLEVFAAGFPLGDPEFTLTDGIVAKAAAETASALTGPESVIQHTADLQHGNSGGPLVSNKGKVVGVNYLGITGDTGTQFFAISAAEAKVLVEQLKTGTDIDSLGINGQAVQMSDGTTGIWVSAVKSGSPAEVGRVRSGDIVLTLEGFPMGADGTIADYCRVIRSHRPTDPLRITVLRSSTLEVLEGVLNERPLEVVSSPEEPAAEPGTGPAPSDGSEEPGADPGSGPSSSGNSYVTVTDATGVLSLDVLEEWTDVRGGQLTMPGNMVGLEIIAAPNVDEFLGGWSTPGISFWASRALAGYSSADEILDDPQLGLNFSTSCAYESRSSVENSKYVGRVDTWQNCGGRGTSFWVVAEKSKEEDHGVLILLQLVDASSGFDIRFSVNGTLP